MGWSDAYNAFRSKMLEMLCPAGFAGFAGLPQMTIPAGLMQDCPVGLSVVGAKYKDLQLLSMAQLISPQGQK
jgi:amidase